MVILAKRTFSDMPVQLLHVGVEEKQTPPFSPQAERAAPGKYLYVDLAVCFEEIQTNSKDFGTDKVLETVRILGDNIVAPTARGRL